MEIHQFVEIIATQEQLEVIGIDSLPDTFGYIVDEYNNDWWEVRVGKQNWSIPGCYLYVNPVTAGDRALSVKIIKREK